MLNKKTKLNSYLLLKKNSANNLKIKKDQSKLLFQDDLDYTKYSPATNKEWNNSIYTYNKNSIKNLPSISKRIENLITNYFNFFNVEIETKLRKVLKQKRALKIKFRRFSIQKIFIGKTTTKHFVSKVIVTLYTFNQQERFLLRRLRINIIQSLRLTDNHIKEKRIEFTHFVRLCLSNNITIVKSHVYALYLKKMLEQERVRIYYKQLLFINRYKFKHTYLKGLKNLISQLYNKQIEFNIINLRVIYLNSDILSEFVAMKVKKARKNLSILLNKVRSIVKIPKVRKYIWSPESPGNIMNQIFVDKYTMKNRKFSNNLFFTNELSYNIEDEVFNAIKYKLTNGIRLEVAGKLSRRSTANRAMFKFKYKGNLRNIDSSFRGVSAVMLRGHLKSNIQYTNLISKTRKGAYGLKGWVSSV